VRLAAIIAVVLLLAVAGLFIYGLTIKPDTHVIEQDAVGVANG
jgi:hypothetical protein